MLTDDLSIEGCGDADRGIMIGPWYFVDIHPVKDWLRDAALIICCRYPQDVRGIDINIDEFVLEGTGRVAFKQAVERSHRVIAGVAARLVDLVKHHDGVGEVAMHQGVRHFAWFGVAPLRGGAGQHPAGSQ